MIKTKEHIDNVILFDGVCNLCNGAVNFVIDRDKAGKFKFASLQSGYGQEFLSSCNLSTNDFNSMVYREGEKVFTKSTAILKIARRMNGPWPAFYAFIIIPRFIRDGIYNFIARNRYSIFGKRDQCRVPTPQLRARFLE